MLEIAVYLLLSLFILIRILNHVIDFLHHLLDCLVIDVYVLDDCLTEMHSDFLEHIGVEMEISIFPKVCSTETCLECVRILDSDLFPTDNSPSSFFGLLDTESAVIIAEHLCLFLEHIGEYSLPVPRISFDTIAIHEYVFLS